MIDPKHLAAFDESLRSGRYSLLFGSGVSTSSKNLDGHAMLSAETLRVELCKAKNIKLGRTLSKVVSALTKDEISKYITTPFRCGEHSPRLRPVANYLWQRIYTFNVDDVIECVYTSAGKSAKQALRPVHFNSQFEPLSTPDDLLIVHLHGNVREEEKGYVFTYTDYNDVMQKINPWMTVLANTLATEPFIVSGTSLAEQDLEYYLSHRTQATPKLGVGPSLLIDPDPDAATENDCARHGLILVKASFEEFLAWLSDRHSSVPSVAQLIVPDTASVLAGARPHDLIRFFSSFEVVSPLNSQLRPIASSFYYGHPPSDDDLNRHADIPRFQSSSIMSKLRKWEASPRQESQITILYGDAGSGKSTFVRRLSYDLARGGSFVMRMKSLNRLDVAAAIDCLRTANRPIFLVVDSLADHAEQIEELVEAVPTRIHVLCGDREYRRRHNETVANTGISSTHFIQKMSVSEVRQLIERMRQLGLVADAAAIASPESAALALCNDPVAVATCRIMRDFAPLERIVDSLWNEAEARARYVYLVAAIAYYCYQNGVQYTLLQKIAGRAFAVGTMMAVESPLVLTTSDLGRNYLVPINGTISERILALIADRDLDLVESASLDLARTLSPYVNRTAIMRRTPEARLVRSLFDVDVFVGPFLRDRAERWYDACQSDWEWNSRFWEQRALLASNTDVSRGLRFARMAVAIEDHPFTLNTLATLLFKQIERGGVADLSGIFDEGFDCVRRAVAFERKKSRVSVYPYMTLCNGVIMYVKRGGRLDENQRDEIASLATTARARFSRDQSLLLKTEEVLNHIGR